MFFVRVLKVNSRDWMPVSDSQREFIKSLTLRCFIVVALGD